MLPRVDLISRNEALKKVEQKKNTNRIVFATTYDPRLPSITAIVKKHYNMCKMILISKIHFQKHPLLDTGDPKTLVNTSPGLNFTP